MTQRLSQELNTHPVWASVPKTFQANGDARDSMVRKTKRNLTQDDCMQKWRGSSADPEPGAAAEPLRPEPDAQDLWKPRGAETRNIGTIAQQLDLNQRNTLQI